jgi:hypothetical protein
LAPRPTGDGTSGVVVTTAAQARELGVQGPLALRSSGFARVGAGSDAEAPVPAARAALDDAASMSDIDVIKTHNPFVVNDLWFARETGVDARALNRTAAASSTATPGSDRRAGSSSIHALEERGGERSGLFTGCAAGDTERRSSSRSTRERPSASPAGEAPQQHAGRRSRIAEAGRRPRRARRCGSRRAMISRPRWWQARSSGAP